MVLVTSRYTSELHKISNGLAYSISESVSRYVLGYQVLIAANSLRLNTVECFYRKSIQELDSIKFNSVAEMHC